MKPYKCMQTIAYYWIEIIAGNHIIINIRKEYLNNYAKKKLLRNNDTKKYKYKHTMHTIP